MNRKPTIFLSGKGWLALTLLLLTTILTGCAGQTSASTMFLRKTEGSIGISDGKKDIAPAENLGLYSGYEVNTQSASYAWIDLDSVKLTKMDQDSEIAIHKNGKKLTIDVKSGALFFNVTQPLEEDETMEIRTSTMMAGIRGTCGWAEVSDGGSIMKVYLLEGKVECTAAENTATVNAGEMAAMSEDGSITVSEFTADDVPDFVMEEIKEDEKLREAIPENDPIAEALAQYRTIISQADSYSYGGGTPTGKYRYALIQMHTADLVPTLLLEQEESDQMYYTRLFQYDPDSKTVRQPEELLQESSTQDGEYRIILYREQTGDGISIFSIHSLEPRYAAIFHATLEGNTLTTVSIWEGPLDDGQDLAAENPIEWHDIGETDALNSWTPNKELPAVTPEPDETASAPLPTDGDRIVLRGTIDSYSTEDLIALQEIPENEASMFMEMDGENTTYRLILLDAPQTLTLRNGDGDGSRAGEVRIIGVTYAQELAQYDGQRLTFSIDPNDTWWPSDVSLPLGEPRTDNVNVLEVE